LSDAKIGHSPDSSGTRKELIIVMFTTLHASTESRKRRRAAFMCGFLIQSLAIGFVAALGLLLPYELPTTSKYVALVWIPQLAPPPKPVEKPRPVVVRKVKLPEPLKFPAPVVTELEPPKIHHTVPPVPVTAVFPKLPPAPVAPAVPPPKAEVAVKTGVFGGAPEKVTTTRPAEQVQTGGFGNPQVLPGKAESGNPGNVPKLGMFGLPEGPGKGNGTGGIHGVPGVVASAGFGSGIAGPGYVRGGGVPAAPVETGSFEKSRQVAHAPVANSSVPEPSEFQPVEILAKPTPVYTEEARRLGIQVEVALSVVFPANGSIRVIGVVRSLGHGLDEAAQQAAQQIRFKPAKRSGQPADFPATLRIEFRLADQSAT
jgi:protein TonB